MFLSTSLNLFPNVGIAPIPKMSQREKQQALEEIKKRKAAAQRESNHKAIERYGYDKLTERALGVYLLSELTWDYADTVMEMCRLNRNSDCRKLCHFVKELKQRYDLNRRKTISDQLSTEIKDKVEILDEFFEKDMRLLLVHIKADILKLYPDIDTNERLMLTAVHQCQVILDVMTRYSRRSGEMFSEALRHSFGDCTSKEQDALAILLPHFLGDCQCSESLSATKKEFAIHIHKIMENIHFFK